MSWGSVHRCCKCGRVIKSLGWASHLAGHRRRAKKAAVGSVRLLAKERV